MIFREVFLSGFEYWKKLTLTNVCSLDRDKVSNICKCHWSEKSLDYGKMDFISHFLYFVIATGIENTTDSVQGWRQKGEEISFITTPAKENTSLHD